MSRRRKKQHSKQHGKRRSNAEQHRNQRSDRSQLPPASPPLSWHLDRLLLTAEWLARGPSSSLSEAEAFASVARFRRIGERADAVWCRTLAESNWRSAPAFNDGADPVTSLATALGVDPASLAADERLGRWAMDHPDLQEAWSDGRITRRHIRVLRAAEGSGPQPYRPDVEEALIQVAESQSWARFLAAVRSRFQATGAVSR